MYFIDVKYLPQTKFSKYPQNHVIRICVMPRDLKGYDIVTWCNFLVHVPFARHLTFQLKDIIIPYSDSGNLTLQWGNVVEI